MADLPVPDRRRRDDRRTRACRGIREHDADGSIGVVGAEPFPPYKRPPLSKALWKGERRGLDLARHRRPRRRARHRPARRLARPRRAHGDRRPGRVARLRAPAARDRRPAEAGAGLAATTSSTSARSPTTGACASRPRDGKRFTVIGGGFIGSEIAAALAMNGCKVTLRLPRGRDRRAALPAPTSPRFVTDYYREQGVEVLAGESVASVDGHARHDRERARARGRRRRRRARDRAGRPSSRPRPGLAVDDGIVVDELGRAGGRDDVFAAGDVARFPAPALGTTMRVEHEDNANSHGRAVGANMAGADEPYDHLPFFYSDLFELGYEAVGEVDSRHDDSRGVEGAEPQRRRLLRRRRGTPARLPALGRLGQGRRRDRADRGGRAGRPRTRCASCSADGVG